MGVVADDPPLPEYPTHSAAFGHLMRMAALPQAQNVVKARESEITNLMRVRDDELVLLHRIGIDHYSLPDLEVSRRTIDVEIARRNIAATLESIKALGELRTTIQALQEATTEAADRTTSAVSDLQTEVSLMSMDIKSLDSTIGELHTTTQAAAKASTQAITRLDGSIKVLQVELDRSLTRLRASGDRWSRWLTRLTIAVVGLTALLVVVALAPVWR